MTQKETADKMEKEQENISKFLSKLSDIAEKVNDYLDKWLPQNEEEYSANLNEAMRYSVMAGGKRIRPALAVLTAEAFGFKGEAAYRAGCAYELYHSASLIHDDLPCMDDDDLRRGKPTNHKVFGEAMALLAGDGLLNLAFEVMVSKETVALVGEKRAILASRVLSNACGKDGMILSIPKKGVFFHVD